MKRKEVEVTIYVILSLTAAAYGHDGQNYELTMVQEIDTDLTKRSLADDNLHDYMVIELQVRGKTKTLRLQRNNNVDINTPITFTDDDGGDNEDVSSVENVGLYQDVRGGAAISVTQEATAGRTKRTFEGNFQVGKEKYGIEPTSEILNTLAKILQPRDKISDAVLHRIFRVGSAQVEDDGSSSSEQEDEERSIGESAGDSSSSDDVLDGGINNEKRANKAIAAYQVEMMFIADHTIFDYWFVKANKKKSRALQLLRKYFAHQINGIDLAFKSIDASKWGLSITPYLKRIHVAKTAAASSWTRSSIISKGTRPSTTTVDAAKLLKKMGAWMTKKGMTWDNPDHVMLWTRYDLRKAGRTENLLGYALIGDICLPEGGVSTVEDVGFHSWSTAVHELAHNLGASHDGERNNCQVSDKYIMTPINGLLASKELLKNAYKFSRCSIEMMKRVLSGKKDGYPRVCLTNRVCKHGIPIKHLNSLPGKKYSLDEQCQLRHGNLFKWIDLKEDVCFKLSCIMRGSSRYKYNNPGAADGTSCGKNKCCRQGVCVSNCEDPKFNLDRSCRKTGLSTAVPAGCTDTYNNCPDYPRGDPRGCFVLPDVKKRCCATCHKAGLIEPTQHLMPSRTMDSKQSKAAVILRDQGDCSDKEAICKLLKSWCNANTALGEIARRGCAATCGTCISEG